MFSAVHSKELLHLFPLATIDLFIFIGIEKVFLLIHIKLTSSYLHQNKNPNLKIGFYSF